MRQKFLVSILICYWLYIITLIITLNTNPHSLIDNQTNTVSKRPRHQIFENKNFSHKKVIQGLPLFNNIESLQYVKRSAAQLKQFYEKCDFNKSIALTSVLNWSEMTTTKQGLINLLEDHINLVQLYLNIKSNAKISLFKIKLKLEFFKAKIAATNNPNCYLQRFDKLLNAKEAINNDGQKLLFQKKNNYEIITDKHGFYYLSCKKVK